ncbi:MAG TPA: DNA polymerase III subunit alpha [Flavobacteriaceae bacterium]|nr:DNA polymerase III subunit alpha [Flavobacteriaceae bacterium]
MDKIHNFGFYPGMYLNCHTYYSLRYGTFAVSELLNIAQQHNVKTLTLTDINSTSASLDFANRALQMGIKPVLGIDFRNGAKQQFVMLAKSNHGFQLINEYLSEFLHNQEKIPSRAKSLTDTFVIYPFATVDEMDLRENEFIGIKKEDINRFKFSHWKNRLEKLVILQTVSFQNKKAFNAHRLLRAIDNNTLLSMLPSSEQGDESQVFVSEKKLKDSFADFPELIENTRQLLDSCNVEFDFSRKHPNNQKTYTGNGELDYRLLRKLTYAGISYRYKRTGERVLKRIEKELGIIREKGFVSYFLINWKILKYARSKGYFYVGRGSGANSIIAYLLRITDVDPVELDLYFERFINLYRQNPPDFDIDFSWQDRDDIIDFVFKRFKNTSLIAVYNTFKYKASVREMGKVFGLPKEEIDKLSQGDYLFENLDKLSQLVVTYAGYIQGFPNYLGIHAGGILISERPINYYTATFMPPKGFATAQFDMIVAEDIGLYKFDILSQRGLGKIKDALDVIQYNRPDAPTFDIHDLQKFKKDEKIKSMLRNGEAVGCFYVESPAMRMLMRKLQVDDYLGLVAASSVIRPGVAKSGMMRSYILRYRYPEKRKEAPPVLLDIMPETFGVMVYQEDVIKVAHHFGGLNLSEADMLRRGMSGKFKSADEFEKVREQFFINAKKLGRDEALTKQVWHQIESFGGYSFAKGHSASYAVESYQSLFLKAHFPLEYMVSTINNGGGFYSVEFYLHETRMQGGQIHPPCINKSGGEMRIYGKNIYIGFSFLQDLEDQTVSEILKERNRNGDFKNMDDFLQRVSIGIEQLVILIKIDAFRFTGRNKRELLWEAHMKMNKNDTDEHRLRLFEFARIDYTIPSLPTHKLEDAFDQIELLGFPLCDPFDLLSSPSVNPLRAEHLVKFINKIVTIEGYLVTYKRTRTSKGESMFFGNFVDRDGHFIDTVHFPPTAKAYRFKGYGIYEITGKVVEEFDCITLEVIRMERMGIIQDPRYSPNGVTAI